MQTVAEGEHLEQRTPGLSLLFAARQRPALEAIDRILASPDPGGPNARISHRPPDQEGWVELLASGLTFELHGLAPAVSLGVDEPAYRFGIDEALASTELEAVALIPGPHIAAGRGMAPVMRTMAGLAANLALSLPVVVVSWGPARSWMDPNYFVRIIVSWLAGGPFPALGLTALAQQPDGGVESVGLAYFAGQEIRVQPAPGEMLGDTAKLAVRVIDQITRHGPIDRFTELDSPSGELILAEPSSDGRRVTVWRGR
ncbi:MAG: hypothetical protein ABIT04_06590 [Novosphingobium sp.]